MLKKRGYIFTLDAIMATILVVIGIFLISASFLSTSFQEQTFDFSYSIISTFSSIKVFELNYPKINDMVVRGDITNTDNRILQQIAEFDYLGMPEHAMNLTKILVTGTIPPQYDFSLQIEGNLIYNTSVDSQDSSVLISSKKILYGIVDSDTLWGPVTAEVHLWQ